ncbi:MAG: YihY/virulence factor BrkB family protein [Candidatus Nanopelagicales bacterium]|jgi:membrane protein|nr:YihY/virulence factor BrkB family protein [Candidatus Nanopelagicales bacterium]
MADDTTTEKAHAAPDPDHPGKPDSPTEIAPPSWKFTAKSAAAEFQEDECLDLAAALTHYSVLAVFPALLALVSLLGVFGQGEDSVEQILELVRSVGGSAVPEQVEEVIRGLVDSGGAGLSLVLGLALALWSASGYVGAFGRALNRVYEVDEGRPFWKRRPALLAVTVGLIVMAAIVLFGLIISGPVAQGIGETLGIGSTAQTVFAWAKWPIILLVVVVMVAVLYYFTPNVQQPKFRWISVGSVIAIVTWILASLAFGFYVSNFSNYNRTYGALAGVIVFLLWLWITNLALLFGAEVDAELERSRQLQAGIEAEETIQLPPKDATKSEENQRKAEERIEEGRALRQQAERERAGAGASRSGDGG